ncbi:multicopper oxidase domain-containing protein [Polyangium sp. y55x31]|uniref:multicopper oxidase domain-containing protein n=1 Tax=Polyangium sp. y55x31 TaxID=3042688 RepID=UPI0024823D2C|nr:multicopper oxidase domain-containing protein [Polyangium sp. y55x31]MDI1479605.1 multicopper oxidase domain-containing protein [Polyangium sp. y55x31]
MARVVAIDQVYVYNRFGAWNPDGMIYALERDVVPIDPSMPIGPGNAMLDPRKRPRPLVLRVNEGDNLVVHFKNWLAPTVDDISADAEVPFHVGGDVGSDSTATRRASFHVNGLQALDQVSLGGNVGYNKASLVAPGHMGTYRFHADHEGTFLAHSGGAMTGGQGLGGQTVLGLFGAVHVEPRNAVWYRSQLTGDDLAAVATFDQGPLVPPRIDYDATYPDGTPIVRILDERDGALEIVHSDLNAVITGYTSTDAGTVNSKDQGHFREMTVLFHDELRAVQAFPELDADPSLHGVRDGFGINYGAAGLGAELLANRARLGPAADCAECKFEEFFLSSWVNGDPAIVVSRDEEGDAAEALFPDDPSNVHHAYLGDPVRIRNLHAGPKETHVFHLHAHQWLQTPGNEGAMVRDSQTVGPGSTYTYDLMFGGAGNRVLTPGDAIFHCHLYPHFAQGMWGLLRVHDVFEDGSASRRLPDGEIPNGTPTPAVVPIPQRGMAPMPTFESTQVVVAGKKVTRPAMPGYPFYIPADPGHRPPQPPLDMVFDGGLPRHKVSHVPEEAIVRGDGVARFDVEILQAELMLLPQNGTASEERAMSFHAGTFPGGKPDVTLHGWPGASYPTRTPLGYTARFFVNGRAPAKGAPFADPCPKNTPQRTFRAAYIEINGLLNQAGWHDPQLRMTVLEEDVPATYAGKRPPEPFFFRANSNDCIQYEATNLLPKALDEDAFQVRTPTDTTGQHIHLVQFDVTSADGSSNGFNYEDGTFTGGEVEERIAAANLSGGAIAPNGARLMLTPKAHPRIAEAPLGAQTTTQRWWASPIVDDLGRDRTLRTVFTHDHLAASSHQQHGLYGALVIEPAGSTYKDSRTGIPFGTRPDGGPTSYRADVLPPAGKAFREFNLAFADFALAYDKYGEPVNPPGRVEAALPLAVEQVPVPPEAISAADPGTMLINYRNEPIPLRIGAYDPYGEFAQKPGPKGEMHNVFRSDLHGDPATPLLEAYPSDPVQIRLIQGAHEEQHVWTLHGSKWLHEYADPDSGYSNADAIGISEHLEFVMPDSRWASYSGVDAVDYLYASAPTDDLWNGMWGLMRCYAERKPWLKPLPGSPWAGVSVGKHYDTDPRVCPAGAPVRAYHVVAIPAAGNLPGDRLTYNDEYDLFDPEAILFVREEHLDDLRHGLRRPEPLVLRAAAGECIQVTLRNELPETLPQSPHWSYYPPIVDGFNTNQVRKSSHVGLHPQLVTYDVGVSDGANVGKNLPQTVAPGEERTYVWYAGDWQGKQPRPIEFGAINLRNMADVVHGGAHGGVGTLVIEPALATWVVDPDSDAQATVTYPGLGGASSFREFVLLLQDDVPLRSNDSRFLCENGDLNCGNAIRNLGGEDDAEDTGHKAWNYRTEPIWARLGLRPEVDFNEINERQLGGIHDSLVFGDPATPIFRATVGQAVRIRQVQPSGHARQHAFTLWGAAWYRRPYLLQSTVMGANPDALVIATQGGASVQTAHDILPLYGAGGKYGVTGDFLYRDEGSFGYTDGLWGILRVSP